MSGIKRATSFLVPKLRHVMHFVMKQGLAMTGNLLYGLLCVRLLPVPDYAKFAVLFGFMGSLTVLLDIGISTTLAPLVGEQVSNLQLIADYVASIRRIALRLYLVVAPAAAVVFVLLVRRQHWGVLVVGQMVVVLLVTAWFARVSSSYGSVLILRRDRNRYYQTQIIGSLGSLSLLILFWALHRLNIYVGILLNVGQIVFIATSYFQRAKHLLGVKGTASKQMGKAVVRLALPNMPSTAFYAIQGQITLMLITVFGHGSASVANIGALGRLGQIFAFIAQMNPILVEPFFAKLPVAKLKRNYLMAVGLIATLAGLCSAFAFLFPEVFLWILGPKYKELRVEVGLVMLTSAISYLNGFIWVINSSRRFVYWWNNLSNIVLILLIQAVFVWKWDLSTVRNVLTVNIVTSVASLLITIACGIYGFWRGPQRVEDPTVRPDADSDLDPSAA